MLAFALQSQQDICSAKPTVFITFPETTDPIEASLIELLMTSLQRASIESGRVTVLERDDVSAEANADYHLTPIITTTEVDHKQKKPNKISKVEGTAHTARVRYTANLVHNESNEAVLAFEDALKFTTLTGKEEEYPSDMALLEKAIVTSSFREFSRELLKSVPVEATVLRGSQLLDTKGEVESFDVAGGRDCGIVGKDKMQLFYYKDMGPNSPPMTMKVAEVKIVRVKDKNYSEAKVTKVEKGMSLSSFFNDTSIELRVKTIINRKKGLVKM